LKLSKTSWLILTVGILLFTFVGLLALRSQQVQEQERLNEELSLAESRLGGSGFEQLLSRQEELEEQLSQTKSQFESASAISPQLTGSIAVSDTLFGVAEASGVDVIRTSSSGLASGDLGGVTCHVLTLTARVEGELPNLTSFIINLIDNLTNGAVKSVEISTPKDTSKQKSSANIKLVIYSYQGD